MPFLNFDSVPRAQQSDWLDVQFGVDHDDLGLDEADARRLRYTTLQKTLRYLLAEGQGAKHGLRLDKGRLAISHALRVRLYRDLEPAPDSQGFTLAQRHSLARRAKDARTFVQTWVEARKALLPKGFN